MVLGSLLGTTAFSVLRNFQCSISLCATANTSVETQFQTQSLIGLIPAMQVRTEPPLGYEFQNSGNYIPNGRAYFQFENLKWSEETEWLDG